MSKSATSPVPSGPARKPARQVVRFCLQPSAQPGSTPDLTPADLIEAMSGGLPFAELEQLQSSLGLPLDRLAARLGLSRATLHRRKSQGRLNREESDRVVRFARLFGRACEVMEDESAARAWLQSPQLGLGGAVPLEFAETEVGAREVEALLGRIEFGVLA
jgi:putative toxin-antitoxin system antitoxin component (TIGR02293 family)